MAIRDGGKTAEKRAALDRVRSSMRMLADDPEALELIASAAERLAGISSNRRR